jgi:hypothetical protein
MIPQKHKEAKKFMYKSGFFITTNVYPDFGHKTDCDAIRKRLSLFNTTKLPKKNAFVTGKNKIITLSLHCEYMSNDKLPTATVFYKLSLISKLQYTNT